MIADVEGSTRLWDSQPEEMTVAVTQLDRTVSDVIAAHGGVRMVEPRESDSVVVVFGRAVDAVVCALALQRASLGLVRVRIGVHTGEAQLCDEGGDFEPTFARAARLRDLARGGQTVLSATTSDLVVDQLPAGAWLAALGTYLLGDQRWPERVVQLCHIDVRTSVPPLRAPETVAIKNLPARLTTFVGRRAEIRDLLPIIKNNKLVTLTWAGGIGKTRLAVEVADRVAGEFADGVCYVDLAPITDPLVVPVTVAHALGIPDQPAGSTWDALCRFVGGQELLLLLDNCEHLLEACAAVIAAVLNACAQVTVLTTSREPIGVGGELTWMVPSLSLTGDAIELFTDRCPPRPPRVPRHRREFGHHRRYLLSPRWHAAGDRTGRGSGPGALGRRHSGESR